MKKAIYLLGFMSALLTATSAFAAADREKLLKDPGVYGTFAVFKVDGDWWKLDKNARGSAAAEVKSVFQKHADKVVTDTYLLRGLSEKADFFVRVHSTEILDNQNFLVDLMGTTLGKYLHNTNTFNGLTKKPNYIPGFSDDLKEALKTAPDPGPKPYVIVVPIRKDAAWWNTPQDRRTSSRVRGGRSRRGRSTPLGSTRSLRPRNAWTRAVDGPGDDAVLLLQPPDAMRCVVTTNVHAIKR